MNKVSIKVAFLLDFYLTMEKEWYIINLKQKVSCKEKV